MKTKLLKKYEVRIESNTVGNGEESDTPVIMHSVYAKDGGYVGPVEDFYKSYLHKGILPELSAKGHNTCSIGKSHIDGKWYGWSHRAMFGFQIGDTVKEGDCCAESLPVGFEAKTEADAKKMAIAFADSVS